MEELGRSLKETRPSEAFGGSKGFSSSESRGSCVLGGELTDVVLT